LHQDGDDDDARPRLDTMKKTPHAEASASPSLLPPCLNLLRRCAHQDINTMIMMTNLAMMAQG
jgi:hypothetical protein